jgi:hypothetical protein
MLAQYTSLDFKAAPQSRHLLETVYQFTTAVDTTGGYRSPAAMKD